MPKLDLEEQGLVRANVRQAKSPKQQIQIEAQLHGCSVADILTACGIDPASAQGKRALKAEKATYISDHRHYREQQRRRAENAKYPPELIKEVVACRVAGMKLREIQERFNLPYSTVYQWCARRRD